VLLLTGLGPAIAIAILWERRIRGFGFEQVPQPVRCRQLAKCTRPDADIVLPGNQPAPEIFGGPHERRQATRPG
jgi:hypothetical protein